MPIRTLIGLALIYVAVSGMPQIDLPSLPTPQPQAPKLETPSVEMRRAVEDVAKICERMDGFDRLVWMNTWHDAAKVVSGESDTLEVEFENTLGLQVWQQSIFDIAWRRIAKASGKYDGLGDAVEQAFVDTIGLEVRAVDDETLEQVCNLYEALAWAGARSE